MLRLATSLDVSVRRLSSAATCSVLVLAVAGQGSANTVTFARDDYACTQAPVRS